MDMLALLPRPSPPSIGVLGAERSILHAASSQTRVPTDLLRSVGDGIHGKAG